MALDYLMGESSIGVTDCQVCEAVDKVGYNPTAFTHCSKCCAIWTGLARAHCNVCHQTFNSDGCAKLHWTKSFGHHFPSNLPHVFSLRSGIWYMNAEWNPSEVFREL